MAHGRTLRWWSLRRLTALLAVVCLAGSSLEWMLPDVHDGDVASVIEQAGGDATGCEQAALASAQTQQSSTPSQSHHDFHVDHCSHAHFAVIQVVASLVQEPTPSSPHPSTRHDRPGRVDPIPLSRPPIA